MLRFLMPVPLGCGALLLAGLAGCATQTLSEAERGAAGARYADVVRVSEQEMPDIRKAPSAKLWPLCVAYSKLRRYDKLNTCLEQMEANVAAGDTNTFDVQGYLQKSPLARHYVHRDAEGHEAIGDMVLYWDASSVIAELRAESFLDLGEPRKAIPYALKMRSAPASNLQAYQQIHGLGLLALSYGLTGERENAERYARELEALSTEFPKTLLKTDKLVCLARAHLALGDYERAYHFAAQDDNSLARAFVSAIAGGSAIQGGMFNFEQIQRRFIRNKSALESGRFAEATAGYRQMLADPATAENGDIYWIVLYDLGRISEHDGNAQEATNYYKQSVDILELQRATLSTEASKIGFVGNKQSVYRDLIRLLVSQKQDADAFEYVERAKARALVDMLASKSDIRVRATNPERARTLSAAASSAEDTYRALDTAAEVSQRRHGVEQAHTELAQEAPAYASLVAVTPIRAADLQRLVPSGEVLLEYYYGQDSRDLFAFLVTREATRAQRLEAAGLVENVRRFRETLADQTAGSDWRAPAATLYDQLIRPLPLDGAQKLTIVAHGVLHYLPFNALYDGKEPLVVHTEIRILPAASVLSLLQTQSHPKTLQLLVFGNPDLGQSRFDLPFAEDEAKKIASRVPRSRVLVRKQATKSAFTALAPDARFVHIASHGAFNPEAPLQSAIYLAPDAGNDGVLKVGELYTMDIEAELVSLSACETGLGKVASGDDVVGLTRGFLYAGARSIVASLWEVDDQATGQLMTSFYQSLMKGSSKRSALRQAQLETRKSNPHPFYWAAFQLTGSAE